MGYPKLSQVMEDTVRELKRGVARIAYDVTASHRQQEKVDVELQGDLIAFLPL
jgi:hypothetical protein